MQQHRTSASPFGQLPEPTVAKTYAIGHEPDCPIFGINLAASLGDFTLRSGYLQTDGEAAGNQHYHRSALQSLLPADRSGFGQPAR